jgi:hypothetical protein
MACLSHRQVLPRCFEAMPSRSEPMQKILPVIMCGGAGTRLWPESRDALTAGLKALPAQQVAQHSAAREWKLQMQLVDATHDRQILGRHWPGLVVDAATADVQNLRLTDNGKLVIAVDHCFALSMPALMSAPDKKLFSRASSPILA